MTYAQLAQAIAQILPEACFGEDNDGQLVIYTGMKQDSPSDNEELVPCEPEWKKP